MRVDLAACYRLVAHYDMDDLFATHISARVPGAGGAFPAQPLRPAVRADHRLRAGQGRPRRQYRPGHAISINPAGFVIHSAVHAARPDAKCVLHTHTVAGMAVASLEEGLLPLTQKSMRFYNRIGYHDYEGVADDLDERPRLVASLGKHNALIGRPAPGRPADHPTDRRQPRPRHRRRRPGPDHPRAGARRTPRTTARSPPGGSRTDLLTAPDQSPAPSLRRGPDPGRRADPARRARPPQHPRRRRGPRWGVPRLRPRR